MREAGGGMVENWWGTQEDALQGEEMKKMEDADEDEAEDKEQEDEEREEV